MAAEPERILPGSGRTRSPKKKPKCAAGLFYPIGLGDFIGWCSRACLAVSPVRIGWWTYKKWGGFSVGFVIQSSEAWKTSCFPSFYAFRAFSNFPEKLSNGEASK